MGDWIYFSAMVAMLTGISAQSCPEVCFCSGTTVQCESLSEEAELQWSVRDMPAGTETLILNDYRSRGIQARTFFRLTELRTLQIESGRLLVSLVKDTFLGLSKLENLTISGTALQDFPERLFELLIKLTLLDIINTPVKSLDDTDFIGLTALKELRITNNGRLITISKQALDPLVNLQRLSLQGSIRLSIQSGMFSKLSKLTTLDLSTVKLVSPVDRGLFEGLGALKSLILNRCDIRSIERDSFEFVADSLGYLDLSKNEIALFKVNTFADCKTLQTLNISHNLLNTRADVRTTFEAKAFSGLVKLTHLDISYTDLGNMTTETWEKVLKPIKKANINAVGCSYHCSCSAADLGNWFRRNDVTISLSCKTPNWIKGTPVKTLVLDTLKCTKPAIGTRRERFQVSSLGEPNATATVVCGAYTFHGFPEISYDALQGAPFSKKYTSESTEHLFDDESRYNSFLVITLEDFNGDIPGKIRCKASNDYGYTEWVVDIPRVAEMKKKVSDEDNHIFKNLPTWVLGACGVGALLFIVIFALVLAWRIRVRRRERDALRHVNKNSDYYLECEKYEKYKMPSEA
ncbi:slit homolog 2 protein-like [Lineus longissimus]|uniref:slit homolog 2 protein-like n=1 Tax=Lineus longissimus TaxID=88925 RepID=UPI002B4C3E89